jgi:hypothetical protein
MAYQKCARKVISLLKAKYPNKDWKESKKHVIIMDEISQYIGEKCLFFDDEICFKVYTNVYNGLTITNYLVSLIDIDLDPSLRVINEYDKDYNDCIIEDNNNILHFNLR